MFEVLKLNEKYEINKQGEIRNRKTKKILKGNSRNNVIVLSGHQYTRGFVYKSQFGTLPIYEGCKGKYRMEGFSNYVFDDELVCYSLSKRCILKPVKNKYGKMIYRLHPDTGARKDVLIKYLRIENGKCVAGKNRKREIK